MRSSRFCNPQVEGGADWDKGLCGCFGNCSLCLYVYFCPCIHFGRAAREVGESCCLCGFLWPLANVGMYAHFRIRGKIRAKYDINGSWGQDCLYAYCCPPCALMQMVQEVQTRSIEPPTEQPSTAESPAEESVSRE